MRTPHLPLTAHYPKQIVPGFVRQLFDRTAGDYDRVEPATAFGGGSWYRRRALQRAGLKARARCLSD
jgi:demethylmenaquinone methyltransferase/2-methoxy-6-polyprenyl-1,4-benzoquinol methylase